MRIMRVRKKNYIVKKIRHKGGKTLFELEEYNKKQYNDLLDDIVNRLYKLVDKKTVVKQSLHNLEFEELLAIRKKLKEGAKPKAKEGCLYIQIGNSAVSIVP